jgi:hypothetical protein
LTVACEGCYSCQNDGTWTGDSEVLGRATR